MHDAVADENTIRKRVQQREPVAVVTSHFHNLVATLNDDPAGIVKTLKTGSCFLISHLKLRVHNYS